MKFRMSDLRNFTNFRRKPKRNVVYKIGYDKFSLKKFVKDTKNYIADEENRRKIKYATRSIKNLFKKIK